MFGGDVAGLGDVNGDGYDDVISAGANAGPGSATGQAFIYLGGDDMDKDEDIILTGESSWNYFGTNVCGAGDVNNDGFADALILAYIRDNSSYFGRVYIFYGGAAMDDSADVVLESNDPADRFGRNASTAGDVNHDGYDDIMVNSDSSRIAVFYGGDMMDNTPDVILTGEAKGDKFGAGFSPAGDVNRDGYDDVIVGAFRNAAGGLWAGRAYIYLGAAAMDANADIILTGAAAYIHYAADVAGVGDMNGDGYNDIVIGAPGNSSNGRSVGSAYFYLGAAAASQTPDVIVEGENAGEHLGESVANAGDVNNDGYNDVIVGAPDENSGRAFLFFGGENIDGERDVALIGPPGTKRFSVSVSSAGDVNGDGYDDVLVGAPETKGGSGAAFIFYGAAVMDSSPDISLAGEAAADKFGFSVSPAGDVNGDGYDDVVIGAMLNDVNGEDAGRVYLYLGAPHMANEADIVFDGEKSFDLFGFCVSGAGDVNGDGYDDIVVGAPFAGEQDNGLVYVYFGSSAPDNIADVVLSPEPERTPSFGYSVSCAGDIDNDGFDDILVGAPQYDSGSLFVFFGGPLLSDAAKIIMSGEAERDKFGSSVSFVGDVNRDGYNELIVAAPESNAAGKESGRAYLYSSSPTLAVEKHLVSRPDQFRLHIFPNPFNSRTWIEFTTPQRERISIKVYDILGRQIMLLFDDQAPAGAHKISFPAEELAGGIYFITLEGGGQTTLEKALLLR